MSVINLAGRFLLELGAIGAVGFWGYQLVGPMPARIVLAIAAATALIVFWALVVAPNADNAIPAYLRVVIGSVALLIAGGALMVAGQPTLGAAFAAAVIVNIILLFVSGHDVPATLARSV